MARDGKVNYEDGTKVCRRCNETKPVADFRWLKDKRLKRGGTYYYLCKPCEAKAEMRGVALLHDGKMKMTDFGLVHENSIIGRMGADRKAAAALAADRLDSKLDELSFERWGSNDFESGYEVLRAA